MPVLGEKVPEGKGNRSPETRAKMAESARRRWADPEKRAAIVAAQNAGKDTPEFREAQSKKMLDQISRGEVDPANRLGVEQSPEEREKRIASLRRRYEDPEKRAALVARSPRGHTRTRPELAVAGALTELGFSFREQVQIDGSSRVWDIAIESVSVVIEVDGCYFHACPECMAGRLARVRSAQKKNIEKDPLRAALAASIGYRFVRVWEHETQDRVRLRELLNLALRGE